MSERPRDDRPPSDSPRRRRRVLTPSNLAAVGIGVVTVALLAIVVRGRACGCMSKVDLARHGLDTYVVEAYPQWAMHNPSQRCPPDLAALDECMTDATRKDPWGRHYEMACDASAAPRDRLRMISSGPDGVRGTDDDLHSWDPAE